MCFKHKVEVASKLVQVVMTDVAVLSFWPFVQERLAMKTRRANGLLPLTTDCILANGVFANLVPESDPDTQAMHRAIKGQDLDVNFCIHSPAVRWMPAPL